MDREKVKKELLELNAKAYGLWVHDQKNEFLAQIGNVTDDALALLKEQEEEIENLKQTCQSMMEGIVVSQPQIVLCKDCKYRECVGRFGDIVCERDGTPHRPEWFCPCGERMTSE